MFKQVKSRRGSGRAGTNNNNVAIKHSIARVPQAAEGQKVMGVTDSGSVSVFGGKTNFAILIILGALRHA